MSNPPHFSYDLNKEQPVIKIKPVAFLGAFFQSGLLSCLILPWIWSYLQLKNTTYFLTTHRIKIRHGVWNRRIREIELYRFQDISVERPFWVRVTQIGYINIYASDINDPWIRLEAISKYERISEMIRRLATERKLEVPSMWI